MSVVEDLEQEFVHGGWEYLEGLKTERAQEDLHVDYKGKQDPRDGAMGPDDRANLSKALSGFANADGGLIVWGVDARRGADDVDEVQDLRPIKDPDRFLSDLQSLAPKLVEFGIPGVRHQLIRNPADTTLGIVVTVVPASDLAPHMATGKGLFCYYRRVGSDFLPMHHYEVADLFGRRPQPKIAVEIRRAVTISGTAGGSPFGFIGLTCIMRNDGRGIARFPCFSISKPEGWSIEPDGHARAVNLQAVQAPINWWRRWVGSADVVVFPSDVLNVVELWFRIDPHRTDFQDLRFTYAAVAEGCAPVEGTFLMEGSEIQIQWRERVAGR